VNKTPTTPGEPGDEPIEGADAGSAEAYKKDWLRKRIRTEHDRASQLLDDARKLLNSSPHEAERLARDALTAAAYAYWLAEETDGAGGEHEFLHQIGRWTRETFGCEFDWDGYQYKTSCPVRIADKRYGASPTLVADKILCSVCDQDLSECPHSRDRLYWVRGEHTSSGTCRVCNEEEECEHEPSQFYRAPVFRLRKGMRLVEASYVHVPADPLARTVHLWLETDDLMRSVRAAFPEAPQLCNHCLNRYHGLPKPLNLNDIRALHYITEP
jgi:hypothetical protein